MKISGAQMQALIEPWGHRVNELMAFRAGKLLGEIDLEAVHPDPDVRMLDLWLSGLRDARRLAEGAG